MKGAKQWLGYLRKAVGSAPAAATGNRPGFVEKIGPQEVRGWVSWSGDVPPRLQLACGDLHWDVDAVWSDRADVVANVPQAPLRCGFFFRLPPESMQTLTRLVATESELTVLADGVRIRFAAELVIDIPQLSAADVAQEKLAENMRAELFSVSVVLADARSLKATLIATKTFRLTAVVQADNLSAADVVLTCGEQELKAVAARQAADGIALDFDMPGFWWTLAAADSDGSIGIQLRVAGEPVPEHPVALDVAWGASNLRQLARSGTQDSYEQLLAVEHAHFLAAAIKPESDVLSWLALVASNYGLGSYLLAGTAQTDEGDRHDIDRSTLLVFGAMREFNRLLPSYAGRERDLLLLIERSLPDDLLKRNLRESLISYFCRIDRFESISASFTREHIDQLLLNNNVWQRSVSLPFLVQNGEAARAIEVIYSLSGLSGWLDTDALAEASRRILSQADNSPHAENFGYALIGLLDAMAADYWARTEDETLIATVAEWFRDPVRFSHWFRRDLRIAALRVYGLSPAFWRLVEPLLTADDAVHRHLAAARARFDRLDAAVRSRRGVPSQPLAASVRSDLAFFRQFGNRDVDRVLRELVCNELLSMPSAALAATDLPLAEMMALGESEVVRFAALPAPASDECLAADADLADVVCNLQSGVVRSSHLMLLRRVERTLRELVADPGATVDVDALARDLEVFGGDSGFHLSVDLLATVWPMLARKGMATVITGILARHLLAAVASGVESSAPPQALLAAMSRLLTDPLATRDAMIASVLREAQKSLAARFAGQADDLVQALHTDAVAPAISNGADVLVVIYSCRKYLDTRVAAIRATWIRDLQARGIPYVILVGDGDDTLDGDVLQLAVSDRYEDLPAKTLAMVRWALANTRCQYLLKVDDDCYLNVDEYFGSMSYRKFHYYGRLLRREKGGMDRLWHQGKSQGDAARQTLDKSPEPSLYADGGGGYALSRYAMLRLQTAMATVQGERLITSSFMEDKLVGDLLALSGLAVKNEDYFTLVRRRFGDNAVPVSVWDNNFFPFRGSHTKLVHLDTPDHMALTEQRLRGSALWPKKLWPSHAAPAVDFNAHGNQLELLTPLEKASALLQEDFFVVAVMRNEKIMLPHFLRHYRELGVKAFIVVDNLSDDSTREQLLAQPDVVLYSADTEYRYSQYGVAWQQTILASHCMNKWALLVDADELMVLPAEAPTLPALAASMDAAGFDAACLSMIDMYPYGDLDDADFETDSPFAVAPWFDRQSLQPWHLGSGHYSNARSYVSALRQRLMPTAGPNSFTAQKFCLLRYVPWMRFCAGLHYIANARVAPDVLGLAHFKYHAGFKRKVAEEVARRQHFNGAQEYRRYQALLAEGGGGFGVEGVSAQFSVADDFRTMLVGMR